MTNPNLENGVYRVEESGWAVVTNGRIYPQSNREAARDCARKHNLPIKPLGTLSQEDAESFAVRKYHKRNWNDLTSGEVVTVPKTDKKEWNRLYMSAFMHRRNHKESGFDFITVKTDNTRGIQVI